MRVHHITIHDDLDPIFLREITRKANEFRSDIKIRVEEENLQCDAKSLIGMMLLSIHRGAKVVIQTQGVDELEAIEMMCDLLESPG